MVVGEKFRLRSKVELKNRLLFAPISTMDSDTSGKVTDEQLAFYKQRTGDVGAIIIASACVSREGRGYGNYLSINHDRFIPSMAKLSRVIKKNDTKAFIQLYHGGALAEDESPKCVSLESDRIDSSKNNKELKEEDINKIISDYEAGIVRAIKAGYDGVEIHAANSYLPNQFLMASWNKRTDRWGGDLSGRMSFLKELILRSLKTIKVNASEPFALGVRLSLEDVLLEEGEKEDSFKESLFFLKSLDQLGLDYLHVMTRDILGTVSLENNLLKLLPVLNEVVKNTPLIGCGNLLQSNDVSTALKETELVSACRAFVFQPTWAKDILDGKRIRLVEQELTGELKQSLSIPRNLYKAVKEAPDWYFYK